MADRPVITRKRRTRQHVIADLSVNHVERHALRAGHVVYRWMPDYGIDLSMYTFDDRGQPEVGPVYFQVKATDHVRRLAGGSAVGFALDRTDLAWWLAESTPVVLVLYDAASDVAYWLHVQGHFAAGFDLSAVGATVTVRLPRTAVFDERAVRHLQRVRDSGRRSTP